MREIKNLTQQDGNPNVVYSPNPSLDRSADIKSKSKSKSKSKRIVHIGLGAFARAHIAVMTQRANVLAGDVWHITGVVHSNQRLSDMLKQQNYRYMVVNKEAALSAEVIDVFDEVLLWKNDAGKIIQRLAQAQTKVVTLTVTEKAYCTDSAGELNFDNPDIHHDLMEAAAPRSVIGLLVQGCKRRMETGSGAMTIVSCDNMRSNGKMLEKAVLAFSRQQNEEVAHWIAANVLFPCSVVDCIVPKMQPLDVKKVQEEFGIRDAIPVLCEPYRQWIIEAKKLGESPQWELSGAQLVDDVAIYEDLKLRIFNATHSILAYAGIVAGLTWVHEAALHPPIRYFLNKVLAEIFASFPDEELARRYAVTVLDRFANPAMEHQLTQIAIDGSVKIRMRWLPTWKIREEAGLQSPAFNIALALWFFCCACIDKKQKMELLDPAKSEITKIVTLLNKGSDISPELQALLGFSPNRKQVKDIVNCYEILKHGRRLDSLVDAFCL